ncbi:carbohydrate porin [Agarivorans gilvus]|uniref:Glycoporin n=1 Tax=Agarivorans gilvus TaxID=680279 RepID=A0ABQ1HXB4_9ALTE|nr:carbohydrate porin [Agarivorans gilvus]GGA93527.1 glycoporin [Agarivorans gilvus]
MNKFAAITITTVLAAASQAQAAVTIEGQQGKLTIGGDVEFNVNYVDKEKGLASLNNDKSWDQDGRFLVSFLGERQQGDYMLRALAQPTYGTDGGVGTDDVWFEVAKNDSWTFRLGRYEAYDMNPLGQDVFVSHSGDTADGKYLDGGVYIYRMLEGRGRSGSAGQAMYKQTFGPVYLEVSTLFGDNSGFFANDSYHGSELTKNNKNAFVVRPVVAYKQGAFSIAAALETNLVSNSTIDTEGNDISDRTGYGLTASYNQDGLVVNLNAARMDAFKESDTTFGANFLWHKFGLGYIYGINDIDDASADKKVSTFYGSYQFANVIVPDFSIYLGAYVSKLSNVDANEDNNFGGRVRFKYLF